MVKHFFLRKIRHGLQKYLGYVSCFFLFLCCMFLCLYEIYLLYFGVIVYTEINYGNHLIVFPCFRYKFSSVVFEKDTKLENMYNFINVTKISFEDGNTDRINYSIAVMFRVSNILFVILHAIDTYSQLCNG